MSAPIVTRQPTLPDAEVELGDVKPVVPVAAAAVAVPAATAEAIPVAYATLVQQSGVNLDFLMPLNRLIIKQQTDLFETITQGCYEAPNAYMVFNADTGRPVFIVREISGDCTRCCCAPTHAFSLQFMAINPDGSPGGILMTMERAGNSCSNPCAKWLCCCNCSEFCSDGFRLHLGAVDHPDGPGNFPNTNQIGWANQPSMGGGLTPTIQLMERQELASFAIVEGPTCFGGCSELCCSAPFQISKGPAIDLPLKRGDSAKITKQKPNSLGAAMREALTDSDVYTMEFTDPALNPYQKATELAALFLVDYMFFERDNGMCHQENGKTYITCFLCYCAGCIIPCNITFGKDEK